MPTQVIFDMTEPDTAALIESWADNTEYEVTILLRTGEGENRHVATAIEVTETGAETGGAVPLPEEEVAPVTAPEPAITVA